MKMVRTLIATLVLISSLFVLTTVSVRAQEKVFTQQELSQFDGKDGHKAYFAYKGKVYDVSESTLWKLGEHFGVTAGKDLTGLMAGAPHGDEVMDRVPLIGVYQAEAPASAAPVATTVTSTPTQAQVKSTSKHWYDGPYRVAGISILGWTGILLAVTFTLNFFTCFALPWKSLPVPWSGSRPGPDALDAAPKHQNLATIHKYFAWATVVIGIVHGVLGLMQVLGFYL